MIAYVDTTHKFSGECRVIENCIDSILVDGITADANNVKTFNLWIRESELVSLFLSVMEKIKPSDDGAFLWRNCLIPVFASYKEENQLPLQA